MAEDLILFLISCKKITNEGMEKLSQSLKELVSLQKISFRFDGYSKQLFDTPYDFLNRCEKISSPGIEKLSQSLKRLTLLQDIKLDFDEYLPDQLYPRFLT